MSAVYAASNERDLVAQIIAAHIEAMIQDYKRVNVTVYDWEHVETYVQPPIEFIDVSFTIK